MGQKVSPIGFRIGVIRDWDARWFAAKNYTALLHEDLAVRDYIKKTLSSASVSRVEIERAANNLRLNIHTAKPGMVIGRGGVGVEELRRQLEKMTGKKVHLNIIEIKKAEMDAFLVAENVASQLEKRIAFRRAMKQAVFRTMRSGAKGIKISCSGRLGGTEMARNESYLEGTVPLQTLRADIDYGFTEARTTYGRIGVKVWIFKGEILLARQNKVKPAEEVEPNVNA
ncbi:MAG TPA: 30S ribosomal protein S3 [Candidatus Limnocylindrales bacterium]|nr:30S ribosomal protein S3 [Candidatus Limnocylindrales bacterium]